MSTISLTLQAPMPLSGLSASGPPPARIGSYTGASYPITIANGLWSVTITETRDLAAFLEAGFLAAGAISVTLSGPKLESAPASFVGAMSQNVYTVTVNSGVASVTITDSRDLLPLLLAGWS